MKRKYCLIRGDGQLKPGDFVYIIWVGSSLREFMKYTLVENFCEDTGWYFELWSPAVDSELKRRASRFTSDGNQAAKPYRLISLSVTECYQTIIDDSWAEVERNAYMTPQETRLRFGHTTAYLLNLHKSNCITMRQPSRRKYLSQRHGTGFYNVVGGIALALILIMLDACISYIFNLNF